jgi:hypothetical protein
VLFCAGDNHAGTCGLPGGGRSPAKPVSGLSLPGNREKNREMHRKLASLAPRPTEKARYPVDLQTHFPST